MKYIKYIILFFVIFLNINYSYNNIKINTMTLTETAVSQKVVKIKCSEMSCEACKRSITKSISQLNGIKTLDIDLETKIISVIYDDAVTDEVSILNAVINAGYEAEII